MRKISTELKEMQGTLKPSREGKTVVTYQELAITPPVPSGWPIEAGKIWKRVCIEMKRNGYLTRGFIATIKDYCWAEYEQEFSRMKLIELGFERESSNKLSIWHDLQERAFKRQLAAAKELGLTPNSASKIPTKVKPINTENSLLV